MKCEVCLELLEEYLDGELPPRERAQVEAHLIACADCAAGFAALTAEQQLFARYDREVEVPPFLWTRIEAHTIAETNSTRLTWRNLFAGATAVLLLAVAVGLVYLLTRRPASEPKLVNADPRQTVDPSSTPKKEQPVVLQPDSERAAITLQSKPRLRVRPTTLVATDQSDVLSSDLAYLDIEEQDTARHIEQTQLLLRSIKNVPISDGDEEIDVSYDKALSRRLLNENVVLRREAEMKAKFPTKTLLADLEPFLIDIANLPDRARPEEVQAIKERVQKTEIVAALLDYQDSGRNNR